MMIRTLLTKSLVLIALLLQIQIAHTEDNTFSIFLNMRKKMVESQIQDRGIRDQSVLKAMLEIPREEFVPKLYKLLAYRDGPLPIGHNQTISQPYIVAYMTEQLDLKPNMKVLEIGTGSGYQAAVLSKIVKEVYSIEIVAPLLHEAKSRFQKMDFTNIKAKVGDGYFGWKEFAPFDAIMLTAAPPEIPSALLEQLKVGGKLIAPVGVSLQELILITKTKDGVMVRDLIPVRFVPMTGKSLESH